MSKRVPSGWTELLTGESGGANQGAHVDSMDSGEPPQVVPTDMDALMAMIDEERASVPADVWASLPNDGAANLDHYLYGSRKRGRE